MTELWGRMASLLRRAISLSTLRQVYAGGPLSTVSGITVNEATALRMGAVYASIRVISETRGSLPIQMYEVNKSGRRARVTQHRVAQLLACEPNPDMTPMVWSETSTAHVVGSGNSYNEIAWDERTGEPDALIPRHWSLVSPFRDDAGEIKYRVTSEASGASRTLDRSQMLHVPGLGGNGLVGWSPIRLAAESIGIGLSQDQMVATFFGNKAKPGMVISVPGTLDDGPYARLKNDIDKNYTNENAFRALLVEGGATVSPVSIPFNEAQVLESREWQGEEIACRIFRLPPHIVGYLRRATFSNIEAQDLYFEKHSMRPWLVRFEQEMNRKLFARKDWGRFYVKHNVDALLRADIKTRYDAYKTAVLMGIKTQNEVRELEDLDPVEGGDVLLKPEAIFGKSGGKPDGKPAPKRKGSNQDQGAGSDA